MKLLLLWLVNAVAVYATAHFVPGIHVQDIKSAFIVALVLGLINTFVRPILKMLSLPIIILTLGLFLLIINAVSLYIVDYFVDGFTIDGFLAALIGSLVISVISYVLGSLLGVK